MNPYKILNLKPGQEISHDELRRAYKKAASEAHPDRNHGNTSKMTEVNLARDILINPERKKRYDEAGSINTGPVTLEEQANQIIGNLFASVVENAPENMPRSVMIGHITSEIAKGLAKAYEAQDNLPRKLKRARKIAGSIDCDPVLQKILSLRITKIEQSSGEINNQIALGEMMMKLMQSIKFR